jgi:formylglycine-generating enzyme required for sulfatase activity
MDADDKQFSIVFSKLLERPEQALPVMTDEIDRLLPPDANDDAKETLAKRKANAAVALVRMERPTKVWSLLRRTPPDDPRTRSYLVHRLSPLGTDAAALVRRLDGEPDVTIRRALLLALGEFGDKVAGTDARRSVLPEVQAMYRNEADAGLHGAAEWLLRQWHQEAWLAQVNSEWAEDRTKREARLTAIGQAVQKEKASAAPQWYVNGQGQTMVVIPGPVEFLMGSPSPKAKTGAEIQHVINTEAQHRQNIGRTYAISAKAVTPQQFGRFKLILSGVGFEDHFRDENQPAVAVSMFDAMAYCNWLSKQEGIPADEWCYVADSAGKVNRMRPNYLHLNGYRLPTEAEIEHATRAGALTTRFYGESIDLLTKYAWYLTNSRGTTWPVGLLKPNDFGLFDIQGNAFARCHSNYMQEFTRRPLLFKENIAYQDVEGALVVRNEDVLVIRGGCFSSAAVTTRSASRNYLAAPTDLDVGIGIRVTRTIRP